MRYVRPYIAVGYGDSVWQWLMLLGLKSGPHLMVIMGLITPLSCQANSILLHTAIVPG